MAEELQYYGNSSETGLTVVARIYNRAGAQVGGDIPTTEVTGGSLGDEARYIGDMPAAANGLPDDYGVRFLDGTTLLGQGCVKWDGTAEITDVVLKAEHDATQAAIGGLSTPLTAAEVNAEVDAAIADAALATAAGLASAVAPLATQASVDVIDALVDAILVDTDTSIPALINAIPASVRAELATELARIDVATSTREAESNAATRHTADLAEHTATQTAIGGLPPPLTAAEVNAEVDTALADYDGPTNAELAAAIAGIPPAPSASDIYTEFTAGTNEDAFKADVSALATQASVDALNDPTAASIATAVRTELTAELGRIDVAVSSRESESDAATRAAADISAHGTTQTAVAALPTATDNADAVWDEPRADHTTAGSYGAVGEWASAGGLDAAGVRAAIGLASANLDTQLSGLSAAVASVPADVRTELTAELGRIDVAVSTRESTTDAAGRETAIIAAVPAASANAAAVRTELTTELGRIDVATSTRQSETDAAARAAADIAEHDQTQVDISNINTGGGGLDAAGVRAAIGLASPNLDTQLTGINTNVDDVQTTVDGLPDAATIAAAVEAAILNEGDGQQVIDAIVQAIGNQNIDQIALVAAIRADLERVGGVLDLIETQAEANTRQSSLLSQHAATQAAISGLQTPLTAAQINAQVDLALSDYDAPTKAELDAAEANIIAASSSLNAADVRNAIGLASANLDVQLAGLSTDIAAVDPLTAVEVRAALGLTSANLDTQLAGISTAIAAVPAGVRTELATELGRIDVAVSSREAESDAATRSAAVQPLVEEVHEVHGLASGNPVTATPTGRTSTNISQTIVQGSDTVTISRN